MMLAIIPARGGSKRLPRKNILEFGGQPLITWVIKTAVDSQIFDRIVVSTDDHEISFISKEFGAEIHQRPGHLADDITPVSDVCHGVLSDLTYEGFFCCMYATAAYLKPRHLRESSKLIDNNTDVVMGVSGFPIHPYKAMIYENENLKPLFPGEVKKKSQQYPKVLASNGSIYWSKTDYFMENPDFYAPRLVGYEIPGAHDIDTLEDFREMEKTLFKGKVDKDMEDLTFTGNLVG